MLSRKRKEVRPNGTLTETYIGPGTRVEGVLVLTGTLRIDGEVSGEIQAEGDVVIGETGEVRADITAGNLVVGGRLTGTASVRERLELLATGKIVGDARMQTLIVEQGGLLEGNCQMGKVGSSNSVPAEAILDPVG